MLRGLRAGIRLSCPLRLVVVCLAIGCLTVSLATRFSISGAEPARVRAVQAHAPDAQRQHLLGDGDQWTAPPSTFTLLEPPRAVAYAVLAIFPSTNVSFESWLYDRPPPSY